jgi:hypothetical protein
LYRLGVQGVKVLILFGAFFSAECGSSISARFLIYRAHTVWFCTLVAILDPPRILSDTSSFCVSCHKIPPMQELSRAETLVPPSSWAGERKARNVVSL